MKKILLIPDSFKGTMSSAEICSIMKKAIHNHFPEAEVISIPVADGGEGSVDAFLEALGGNKVTVTVKNPYFEDMEAFYGVLEGEISGTVVIEMAASAGLPLVLDRLNPNLTTTYGVGQLMEHALINGCKKIIMGLGGSATTDGGCGAAAALGVKFFDKAGKDFVPTGGTLKNIARIDLSTLNPLVQKAEIITMCDINNPLYGETGAAYVFGPQKGADEVMIKELDAGLRHLAEIVIRDIGLNNADFPGTGAAGGMGYGMLVLLGSQLKMGIETVLDTVHFDKQLIGADFVFSGEGKIDTQSLRGKVVIGVGTRTKKAGVPLVAVVGDIGDNIEKAYDMGVSAVFSINRVAVPFSEAKLRAKSDIALTMDNIIRFIKTVK